MWQDSFNHAVTPWGQDRDTTIELRHGRYLPCRNSIVVSRSCPQGVTAWLKLSCHILRLPQSCPGRGRKRPSAPDPQVRVAPPSHDTPRTWSPRCCRSCYKPARSRPLPETPVIHQQSSLHPLLNVLYWMLVGPIPLIPSFLPNEAV